MKDICIDYCESTMCDGCKYKNASAEERSDAYENIIKECNRFGGDMKIKTHNYTVQGCNEFLVKEDGIYHCVQIWKSDTNELKDERLIIPKEVFIEAFEKWCK